MCENKKKAKKMRIDQENESSKEMAVIKLELDS